MGKNDPESVAAILAQLKQDGELAEQLEYAQIWERWKELAGSHRTAFHTSLREYMSRYSVPPCGLTP